mgnify:CR=1 FL=1
MKISRHPVSLDRPVGESEDSYFGDFIEDDTVESPVSAATNEMLKDNPRLMADVKRGHTFFAVDPSLKEAYGNGVTPAGYSVPQPGSP